MNMNINFHQINSLLSWTSFDWTIMVEKIKNINLKSEYFGDIVKTVLSWVVIARIVIAHLYTVTYLANFYSIFTHCRPNVLLPWMIVSGFKNFILEFIVIMVCLLLYSEKEFSRAWLTAFIVCKLVSLVPAAYYWLTVNSFFIELLGIQRRKLTRAILASNADGEFTWSADVGERLRFRSMFAGGFAYRQRIFMSLVNLDDFLVNSSLEFDGERDHSKIFKSLATLESQESEHADEDSRLHIVEHASLTPVEKSLRILGLNRDDINETRLRLRKNVLTGSNIEDIEEIVSTVEPKDEIESIGGVSTEHKKTDASTANATMETENNAETRRLLRNVNSQYEAHSTAKFSKQPAGNTLTSCTCGKGKEQRVAQGAVDLDVKKKRPSNDSSHESRRSGYERKNSNTSQYDNFPENHPSPLEKLAQNGTKVDTGKPIESNFEYPEGSKCTKAELFRPGDVHLEQDNFGTTDSYIDMARSHDVQAKRSLFRIVGDRSEICTQTDFVNDAGQWSNNKNLTENDFLQGTTKTSTLTQTNTSDSWKTMIFQKTSDVTHAGDKDFFRPKPSGRASSTKAILFAGVTKFSRPKKRRETLEEREARELRALRIYNNRTLFKMKQEMEARTQKSAFGSNGALRNPILTTKDMREFSVTPRERKDSTERLHLRLDQISNRQARSKPRQRTSNWSAFNVTLDALEYAILLSFSSGKKNQMRHQDSSNNSEEIPPIPPREQLSEYSKPTTIREGLKTSSPSTTRFEGLQKGRDLDRTPGVENITNRKITVEINSANCTSNLPKPIDSPELSDKHGISSLKELIKNIDWGFNDHHDSKKNDALPQDNFVYSVDDVLYDIIDDTDVISLLQSAFASNPGNTERGFYLGPGSTELYSVTNYLDDVVGEIMKTARLRPNPDAFANEPTTEVDYGEHYLQELQMSQLLALDGIDEGTDSDSEASDDSEIEDITSANTTDFHPLEPIEMCWSSYSGGGLVPQGHYQSSLLSNTRPNKGIADILGEKEISSLEFWMEELMDLASDDQRDNLESTKQFRHLIEIPGYCVVKTLVDFFREFVAVSRSTMTSRMFVSADPDSTSSSLRSEEIISGGLNDHSNTSLVDPDSMDPQNMTLVEIIDEDVADFLRTLMDRLTENTEDNDLRDGVVVGMHVEQTMLPLREDEFYFGPPENTQSFTKGNLLPEFEAQNHEFVHSDENQTFHLANLLSPQANVSYTISGPEVRNDETMSSLTAKGLHSITLTVNSYDSFYSSGADGTSKHSNNVSIDGNSLFEDFTEHPLNSTTSDESLPQYTTDLPHSEN